MDNNRDLTTLFEFDGAYGGGQSRDQLIRALREALVLVEITASDEVYCSPFRIQAHIELED